MARRPSLIRSNPIPLAQVGDQTIIVPPKLARQVPGTIAYLTKKVPIEELVRTARSLTNEEGQFLDPRVEKLIGLWDRAKPRQRARDSFLDELCERVKLDPGLFYGYIARQVFKKNRAMSVFMLSTAEADLIEAITDMAQEPSELGHKAKRLLAEMTGLAGKPEHAVHVQVNTQVNSPETAPAPRGMPSLEDTVGRAIRLDRENQQRQLEAVPDYVDADVLP